MPAAPVEPHRYASGDEPSVSQPPKPESIHGVDSVNPYAPVGWAAKCRVEFDVRLPDVKDAAGNTVAQGQLCRLIRLERDDLFRLNLHEYLDTFTPILMGQEMSEDDRREAMEEKMQEDPEALTKMLGAIDIITMAACIKPRITDDPSLVDIGTPDDWTDPNFVATVPLENISLMDRMFIFGAAFGRSMDDLKSLYSQTEGMGSLANDSGLQQVAQ
jgi:hypothetical protein